MGGRPTAVVADAPQVVPGTLQPAVGVGFEQHVGGIAAVVVVAAVEQLMAHLARQLGQSHGVDLQLGQHIGQSVLAQTTLGQLQNGLVVR